MKNAIPEAILTQHTAVLGKTGSGKTTTCKLIIEQVVAHAGARVCILDPVKSDHWGLTSHGDGKAAGLPFQILGGPHGHVPLHAGAGAAIAEVVASGALPLSIIDMSDFKPGGLQQFFTEFAPVLLRKMKGVLYLVIEEAHEFAPKERAGIGAETLAIHWAKKLATAGRSKGIRMVIATQRTQSLHNSLLGSCDTMIAHRMTAPADQKPIVDWLQANVSKEIMLNVASSLSSLKTGEAWICSGEAQIFERKQFPRAATYDNTATPTNNDHRHNVKTAMVDVDGLRALIGDAVKEAEEDDPKVLKAKIEKLERDAKKPQPAVATFDEAAARAAGYHAGVTEFANSLKGIALKIDALAINSNAALTELNALVEIMTQAIKRARPPIAITSITGMPIKRLDIAKIAADLQRTPGTIVAAEDLPKGERAILIACAQHDGGCDREQLSILTGYKKSTRNTYLQRLLERGMIREEFGRIMATEYGRAHLGDDFKELPTGAALREHWLSKLPAGESKILEIVCDAYPDAISRERITEATDYKKSTRNTYLQRLEARKLVSGDSKVIASSILF